MTLVALAIYGSSIALLQVTLYGVAGPKPELTNAFMVANGLSSLSVNLLRIFMLAFIPDKETGAKIFFGFSVSFLTLCTIVSFLYLRRYPEPK